MWLLSFVAPWPHQQRNEGEISMRQVYVSLGVVVVMLVFMGSILHDGANFGIGADLFKDSPKAIQAAPIVENSGGLSASVRLLILLGIAPIFAILGYHYCFEQKSR